MIVFTTAYFSVDYFEDLHAGVAFDQIRKDAFMVRSELPDRQQEEAVESFNNYIEFCPAAPSVIGSAMRGT